VGEFEASGLGIEHAQDGTGSAKQAGGFVDCPLKDRRHTEIDRSAGGGRSLGARFVWTLAAGGLVGVVARTFQCAAHGRKRIRRLAATSLPSSDGPRHGRMTMPGACFR